jgi:hypothetical protein
MGRSKLGSLILVATVLSACDQGTNPQVETLDEAAVAQFAEIVSESGDIHLPSLGALLRASREAIDAQGGNEEAVQHFRRAHRLANAAEAAREAGNLEEAESLGRQSYRHRIAGIVAALGSEAVGDAVAGSAAGLARLEAHLEGRVVPERVSAAVARIARAVAEAETAYAGDRLGPALHHALAAAEGIRHLSPRYVATRWIQRATQMLRSARQAVGDAPTDDEATALRRAGRLLNVAKDAFDAGDMGGAVAAAMRSATLSWGVVEGRSG